MINDEDGDDVPSLIQQLFGLKTASVSQCSQCGNEASRVTYPFVVDLVYPKKVSEIFYPSESLEIKVTYTK